MNDSTPGEIFELNARAPDNPLPPAPAPAPAPPPALPHPHEGRGPIFDISLQNDIDRNKEYGQLEVSHGIELCQWEYEDLPESKTIATHTSIENDVLADWLENTEIPKLDQKPPVAGLRLAFCYLSRLDADKTLRLRGGKRQGRGRDVLVEVLSALDLCHEVFNNPISPLNYTGTFSEQTGQRIFHFKVNFDSNHPSYVILSYNPTTNFSRGCVITHFLLASHNNYVDMMIRLYEDLRRSFYTCVNVLFTPLLVSEYWAQCLAMEVLKTSESFVDKIDWATGYGVQRLDPPGANFNAERGHGRSTYEFLARRLGELQSQYAITEYNIMENLAGLRFAIKELESMENVQTLGKYQKSSQIDQYTYTRQRFELLQRYLSSFINYNGLKERMAIQQTVLFNRISQKDSELNYGMAADTKEISIATKRDSSSMKVVALLTTIFLPGTFVSALFSMPLFKWDAPRMKETTTKRFWIYWAVTIPLTLAVMGALGLYIWYIHRQNEIKTQNARKKTGLKEA